MSWCDCSWVSNISFLASVSYRVTVWCSHIYYHSHGVSDTRTSFFFDYVRMRDTNMRRYAHRAHSNCTCLTVNSTARTSQSDAWLVAFSTQQHPATNLITSCVQACKVTIMSPHYSQTSEQTMSNSTQQWWQPQHHKSESTHRQTHFDKHKQTHITQSETERERERGKKTTFEHKHTQTQCVLLCPQPRLQQPPQAPPPPPWWMTVYAN